MLRFRANHRALKVGDYLYLSLRQTSVNLSGLHKSNQDYIGILLEKVADSGSHFHEVGAFYS